MARYCPECGAQLPTSARFCVSCGSQVPGAAHAAERPEPPTSSAAECSATEPTPTVPGDDGLEPTAALDPVTPPSSAPVASASSPRRPSAPASMSEQFSAWPDGPHEPSAWDAPREAPVPPGYGPPPPVGYGAPPPGYGSTAPGGYGEPPYQGGPHQAMPTSPMGGYPPVSPGYDMTGQGVEERRRTPLWPLVALAVLVVAGLLWAVLALRPDSGKEQGASPAPSSPTISSSSTTPVASKAQTARAAVGSILEAGRNSRSTLRQGIDAYCTKKDKEGGARQMQEALDGRTAQLTKLNEIGDGPFQDVAGALAAREALKSALQASAEADQVYVRMAAAGTVCAGSAELTQANAKASAAKATFLGAWNPIMEREKLAPFKEDDI